MPKDIKCYPIISFVDIKYLGKFEQMITFLGYFKNFFKKWANPGLFCLCSSFLHDTNHI